jgi:hypothetical protein
MEKSRGVFIKLHGLIINIIKLMGVNVKST